MMKMKMVSCGLRKLEHVLATHTGQLNTAQLKYETVAR